MTRGERALWVAYLMLFLFGLWVAFRSYSAGLEAGAEIERMVAHTRYL